MCLCVLYIVYYIINSVLGIYKFFRISNAICETKKNTDVFWLFLLPFGFLLLFGLWKTNGSSKFVRKHKSNNNRGGFLKSRKVTPKKHYCYSSRNIVKMKVSDLHTSLSSSSRVNSFFFTTLSWLRKLNSAAFFWSLANLFSYLETFFSGGLMLSKIKMKFLGV